MDNRSEKRQRTLDGETTKHQKTSEKKHDLRLVLKDLIETNSSFRDVEKPHRQKILERANLPTPSRKVLAREMKKCASTQRTKLYAEVRNCDCCVLCIDVWTSNSHQDFLSILAFFVDSSKCAFNSNTLFSSLESITESFFLAGWKLRGALIGFEHIPGRHTGENISKILQEVTQAVGLSPTEQVSSICSDSGADILSAARQWQSAEYKTHVSRQEPLRFSDHCFMIQLPCFMHNIHNAIKNAIRDAEGISEMLDQLKKLNSWIRNSSVFCRKLQDAEEELGMKKKLPVTDVETRWHSTHTLLHRLLELKPAIAKMVDDITNDRYAGSKEKYSAWQRQEVIEDEQLWNKAEALSSVLSETRRYSRLLELQEPFSLTFVLLVYTILCKSVLVESAGEDRSIQQFKKKSRDYLETRIQDQNLAGAMVCCALDPRFLKPEIILGKGLPRGTAEAVRDWLDESPLFPLLQLYVRAYWTRHLDSVPHNLTRGDLESTEETTASSDTSRRNRSIFGQKSASFTDLLEQELKAYRWNAERTELQPLAFWKFHESTLPLLSGAAKILLPFPASSAPAERTFSIAGNTQHRLRKQMRPDTLKDLLTLKHVWLGWLDASKGPPEPIGADGMDCEESDSDSEAGDASESNEGSDSEAGDAPESNEIHESAIVIDGE